MLLDFSSLDGMLPNSRTYAATGGAQTGGAATPAKTKTYVPSGGGTLGGGAIVQKTKLLISSGGVLVGGSAITSFHGAFSHTFVYAASGGARFGGSADGIPDNSGSITHYTSFDREGTIVLTTRHFLSDPSHADFLARTNGTLNERGKRRHLDQGEDAHRGH